MIARVLFVARLKQIVKKETTHFNLNFDLTGSSIALLTPTENGIQ